MTAWSVSEQQRRYFSWCRTSHVAELHKEQNDIYNYNWKVRKTEKNNLETALSPVAGICVGTMLHQDIEFWLVRDSEWHWLDGSVVDSSVTPWCPQNTEKTALGTQCIAYDPVSRCLTNQPCSTQLPGPCVPGRALTGQSKALLSARVSSSGSCTNAYGGAYANWWTYSMLLLNWFILFCFILYLCNRLLINKRTTIVTVFLIVVSFLMIMAFAVLWGLQCKWRAMFCDSQ